MPIDNKIENNLKICDAYLELFENTIELITKYGLPFDINLCTHIDLTKEEK